MRAKRIFYTRFQKILCVFFQIFRFLVKLKPNEKAIQKIICIDCDHGISKCTSISELSPPDNRPRDASWPVQQTNTFCQFPRNTLYIDWRQIQTLVKLQKLFRKVSCSWALSMVCLRLFMAWSSMGWVASSQLYLAMLLMCLARGRCLTCRWSRLVR